MLCLREYSVELWSDVECCVMVVSIVDVHVLHVRMYVCMVHGVEVNILRAWYWYEHLLHNNVFLV